MEKILEQAALQVPSLVVFGLCGVTIIKVFITYLKHRDNLFADIHKEHLDARQLSREAIKENSTAMQHNTAAIDHLSNAVERLKVTNHG